jgi:two-component system, LytTR family, response regulator
MKTVIIEDELLVAKDLKYLIAQIDPTIEILNVLDSLHSSIAYFKHHAEPDLIFMDIQLSDGVSFDLFKYVNIRCPIIFTTAYNEYAIRAFKVNSIDYLLKPVDKEELRGAIFKYKSIREGNINIKEHITQAISQLASASRKIYKERFMVHSGKSLVVINSADIAYFVKDTLIYLVTNDHHKFLSDLQTMEEAEDLLDPKSFYRANRQYIVSIWAIESFRTDMYSKIFVQLKVPLNISIDISREKAQAFKNWIH